MNTRARKSLTGTTQMKSLPAHNAPEKIIIVLDRACDEVFSYFELEDGTKCRPLQMLKNSLHFLVHNKIWISDKHQFALMVLNTNSVSWLVDFTNDVQSILKVLNDVEECETEDVFDLNLLFDVINQKVNLPPIGDNLQTPPPFCVRLVLCYARSFTLPNIKLTDDVSRLLNAPYFNVDIVMTHETPDSSNKCEVIFEKLNVLNVKHNGYFFKVNRNSADLHLAMGKLCGHPLQRPPQF